MWSGRHGIKLLANLRRIGKRLRGHQSRYLLGHRHHLHPPYRQFPALCLHRQRLPPRPMDLLDWFLPCRHQCRHCITNYRSLLNSCQHILQLPLCLNPTSNLPGNGLLTPQLACNHQLNGSLAQWLPKYLLPCRSIPHTYPLMLRGCLSITTLPLPVSLSNNRSHCQ